MLQPVFDLLLWSIEQVQEYQAPSYELAVSVLQSISQVRDRSTSFGTSATRFRCRFPWQPAFTSHMSH